MPVSALFLAADGGVLPQVLTFGGVILIFWLVLLRPQQRERKLQDAMRKTLGKGDEVLLQAGILARVHSVGEKEVVVELEGGGRMRVLREAVLRRVGDDVKAAAKKPAPAKAKSD